MVVVFSSSAMFLAYRKAAEKYQALSRFTSICLETARKGRRKCSISLLCPVSSLENVDNNINFPFKIGSYKTESTGRALKITILHIVECMIYSAVLSS